MNKSAIIVYIDDNEKIIKEFAWLYKSWRMWDINNTWDIVAFTNPEVLEKVQLTYSHDNVKFIAMEPVNKDYPFTNSYGMFKDKSNIDALEQYDFLFKTDCDTFLTKNFATFSPWKDKVYCGIGMYSNFEGVGGLVREKLRLLSKSIGLKNNGYSHLGASLVANKEMMIGISNTQLSLTNWLLENAFKNGDGQWPGWYKGVTALYAHDMAINHLVGPLSMHQGSIDVWCADNNITSLDLHIHAWQQGQADIFNKAKWHAGELPNVKFGFIPKTAGEYCLLVANETVEYLKELAQKNK